MTELQIFGIGITALFICNIFLIGAVLRAVSKLAPPKPPVYIFKPTIYHHEHFIEETDDDSDEDDDDGDVPSAGPPNRISPFFSPSEN